VTHWSVWHVAFVFICIYEMDRHRHCMFIFLYFAVLYLTYLYYVYLLFFFIFSFMNIYDSPILPDVVRYDTVDHLPSIDNSKNSYEMQASRKHFCKKCKVHLCLALGRNCFADFHILEQ